MLKILYGEAYMSDAAVLGTLWYIYGCVFDVAVVLPVASKHNRFNIWNRCSVNQSFVWHHQWCARTKNFALFRLIIFQTTFFRPSTLLHHGATCCLRWKTNHVSISEYILVPFPPIHAGKTSMSARHSLIFATLTHLLVFGIIIRFRLRLISMMHRCSFIINLISVQ